MDLYNCERRNSIACEGAEAGNKKLKRREHAEKRERKMVGISLRGFVTVLIIVLCAGIMIIYSALSNRLYMQRYQDQLEKNVISQTAYLKNNLEANHLSLSKPEKLELQIESMANALYGRILVIDRDYRIVKDTYGNEESAHIINSDVIAVMCGQTTDKMMKKMAICNTWFLSGTILRYRAFCLFRHPRIVWRL